MNTTLKILLSIPSLILLIAIPYNFFSDLEGQELLQFWDVIYIVQIMYLVGLLYILFNLWQNPKKSKSMKWTWTLLIIFLVPPITTLVYLWAIEPKESN